MKTLILQAEKVRRFMEESKHMPKPMIPINGKPMIFYIIDHYLKFDFVDFVILGGTKINYIFDYFEENFSKDSSKKNTYILKKGVSVKILDTGENTMTGGRVKRAIDELNLGNFMLTYGDGFCDVNINDVVTKFHEKETIGTVTAVRPPARFGSLDIEGDYVKSFGEKNQAKEGWINGGFFVFKPEIKEFISDDTMPLEKEPLETLSNNKQLSVYQHNGFFNQSIQLGKKNS